MNKERSEEIIEKIHKVQLDLLEKFHDACKKLNLRYSISSGSLLGAVRHGGFIPWDDDIDVAMPREDYEKFLVQANGVLPEGYVLQHFTNDKYTVNVFAKIRNENTTWIVNEDILKEGHCLGFGMDIFPIDKIPNEKTRKKLNKKIRYYNLLRYNYYPNLKIHKNPLKKFAVILLSFLAKFYGFKRLNQKQEKLQKEKYNYGDLTCADSVAKKILMPYSVFESYSTIEFEGKTFDCVKDYELYLISMYGDNYMELPPENKRVTHLANIIDCENSYRKYLK